MSVGFYLTRIDPQIIVRAINEKTSESVVHAKESIFISQQQKEKEKEERRGKTDRETSRKRLKELSDFIEANDLDIYFLVGEENNQLTLKVFERDTDKFIREFGEPEIEQLLQKLISLSGLLVDVKG